MRWGSARTARTSGETRALESEVPRHESRAPRSGEQFVFAIFICSAASLWILIRFHSFETSSAWAFIRLNFPLFKLSSVWTLCTHSQTPRLNFEASSPESDKRVFLVVSFSLKHLESASTRLERLLREYSAIRFEWRCTGQASSRSAGGRSGRRQCPMNRHHHIRSQCIRSVRWLAFAARTSRRKFFAVNGYLEMKNASLHLLISGVLIFNLLVSWLDAPFGRLKTLLSGIWSEISNFASCSYTLYWVNTIGQCSQSTALADKVSARWKIHQKNFLV